MKLRKAGLLLALTLMQGPLWAKNFYQLRTRTIEESKKSANHNRVYTNKENYNSYDHAGLFSGKLDKDISPFSGSLSGRMYKGTVDDSLVSKNKQFYLPAFNIGTPGSRIFSGYYHLQPKSTPSLLGTDTLSMLENKFGLAFGAQTDDKTFRFAFDFGGAAGKEKSEEHDGKRVFFSLDNLEIIMGSKPSELVTLSIAGGSDAVFDSLNYDLNNDNVADRFFEITLPRITFAADLGDSSVPYRSAFAFTYARQNFVYSTRNPSQTIKTPGSDDLEDCDAIISDSTNWHWMNQWDIDASNDFQIHPAFELGYVHNRHKRMFPGSKNHPFAYDDEVEGKTWEEKSFLWGIGTSVRIVKFIDLFTEFSRNTFTLDLTGKNMSGEVKDNDGYNRLITGFSLGFHDIYGADFAGNKLFFDFSFLNLNENGIYNDFYGANLFTDTYGHNSRSQEFRYTPVQSYNNEIKTNRIGLGIRGIFKDGQVETAINIGFINQQLSNLEDSDYDEESKGFELNFDIIYNVESFAKE